MADQPEPIAVRIRRFRRSMAGCDTQKSFAAALGIDQQRLSGYENGTRVPHSVIASMVAMGANPFWLLFGEGEMRMGTPAGEALRSQGVRVVNAGGAPADDRQLAEFYALPLYADESAVATPPDRREAEIEGPAILHRAWCPHPAETDYVRVRTTGHSMEPTLPPGSIVTVDRAQTDPDEHHLVGKVVAIALAGGSVALRRLQRTERGGFVGVPDNPSPTDKAVHLGAGDRIIGLVQTVHARIG